MKWSYEDITCVGKISKDILESCKKRDDEDKSGEARNTSVERIEELSEQIKFLIKELELKTEELDNLNSKYNKIENEQSRNNQLVKSMREHQYVLRTTITDQDKMLAINGTANRQSSKKVAEVSVQTEQSDGITQVTLNLIEKSIERIVDEKLSNVVSRINASNKTYAETLRSVGNRDEMAGSTAGKKPTEDSRRITIDTRNELITRENEREVRANNFIIHGIEEKGEDLQDIKKNDSQIIKLFFEKVEVGAQPTHYIRLGKPNVKKKRPLKVLIENKHEKDKVMSNIKAIKRHGNGIWQNKCHRRSHNRRASRN